jgi:hypothetical protein
MGRLWQKVTRAEVRPIEKYISKLEDLRPQYAHHAKGCIVRRID